MLKIRFLPKDGGLGEMKIELKQLSVNDGLDVYQMLKDIPENENGFINSAHNKTYEEYKEWLIRSDYLSKSNELMDGWKVPSTTYWLYDNDKPVAVGKLRHFLTEKLLEEGGHIGYAVSPHERNKGYGTLLLKEIIKVAQDKGIDRLLVTIHKDNEYSLKVALANGGVIEKQNETRCYIWISI